MTKQEKQEQHEKFCKKVIAFCERQGIKPSDIGKAIKYKLPLRFDTAVHEWNGRGFRSGTKAKMEQYMEMVEGKPCKHENIDRNDGLDQCLDCGATNYYAMQLTGKGKQDFESYLFYTHYNEHHDSFTRWNNLLDSEKFGVLEDFFDSVGIEISVEPCTLPKCYIAIVSFDVVSDHKKRPEARIAVINKANEIFNER